jgi:RNA polymerase sigma-70 factor (ECF subfamily)
MHQLTVTAPVGALAQRFETFYRNERDHVVRVLTLTLRNVDMATEATDEAMVRAFQRWRTVEGYDNPAGWVYRVALNWATSGLHKQRWQSQHEPPDHPVFDSGVDIDLEKALAALDVESRALVVLKHFEGLRYDEIGRILGMPSGTVKSRLHRVMNSLKNVLEVEE